MIALWIALAVVAIAVIVTGSTVYFRRRTSRAGTSAVRGAGEQRVGPPGTLTPPEPTGPPPQPAATPAPSAQELTAQQPEYAGGGAADVAVVVSDATAAPPMLRDRMGKTRGLLSGYVRALRARASVDEQTWEELEEALLRADVGVSTTTALLGDLRTRVRSRELRGPDAVLQALRDDLRAILQPDNATNARADDVGDRGEEGVGASVAGSADARLDGASAPAADATPAQDDVNAQTSGHMADVWLFVGVNGVGKTTTIGKVARHQVAEGRSVVLAAGDTFRAAAAEQLAAWAERIGVPVVRGAEGGDPSAVVYDAVRRAAARGGDLVLADTAGRLHTKVNLVEELKKIRRVADRPPGRVTEVLLVLDATTGQNGLAQARQFTRAVGVTGVVLTKLDGTAKGGIVVAIQRELGLPVKLVGIGEGVDDLVPFDADEFVDALFD
jgi:fused signal recognition particle receptor